MVRDLTGMDVANASLLDEATAAAEAMTLLRRVSKKPVERQRVPRVGDVLPADAGGHDLACRAARPRRARGAAGPDGALDAVFGMLLQYPDADGAVADIAPVIAKAREAGVLVAVASDLLALTLLVPPGEMGADVVLGSAQRFGVPMGYGGPHAAFFATREAYVRQAPGRIIGVSVDAHGNPALRMALQTREQHIRREKATSNICTAQALLANMAGFYGVYHGPDGPEGHRDARARDGRGAWPRCWRSSGTSRRTPPTSTRCALASATAARRCCGLPGSTSSTSGTSATATSGSRSTRPCRTPTWSTSSACSPRPRASSGPPASPSSSIPTHPRCPPDCVGGARS